MKRFILVLAVAAVMAAMMLASALPALAAPDNPGAIVTRCPALANNAVEVVTPTGAQLGTPPSGEACNPHPV